MTRTEHLLLLGFIIAVVWFIFTTLWPRLLLSVYKRAILVQGGGEGPIPVNTLYTEPKAIFADPLHPPVTASKLFTTGVNRDTLATTGWLDLSTDALVLHVPEMDGRYYSVQFTNPSDNTNFAYVGKRTTGTHAGNYLVTGPRWKGNLPTGLTQISSPKNSVLVLARVFVENANDLDNAYNLSKKIQLSPLSGWLSAQSVT